LRESYGDSFVVVVSESFSFYFFILINIGEIDKKIKTGECSDQALFLYLISNSAKYRSVEEVLLFGLEVFSSLLFGHFWHVVVLVVTGEAEL